MSLRAFPVIYAADVQAAANFWELLGFSRHVELVRQLAATGVQVLREPDDMPWGERIATVTDPDGNPVALCQQR